MYEIFYYLCLKRNKKSYWKFAITLNRISKLQRIHFIYILFYFPATIHFLSVLTNWYSAVYSVVLKVTLQNIKCANSWNLFFIFAAAVTAVVGVVVFFYCNAITTNPLNIVEEMYSWLVLLNTKTSRILILNHKFIAYLFGVLFAVILVTV